MGATSLGRAAGEHCAPGQLATPGNVSGRDYYARILGPVASHPSVFARLPPGRLKRVLEEFAGLLARDAAAVTSLADDAPCTAIGPHLVFLRRCAHLMRVSLGRAIV